MSLIDELEARVQAIQALAQQAASQAAAAAAKFIGVQSIQAGNGQLINGAIGVILGPGKLNANSRIVITMKDAFAGGGAITGFASFDAFGAGRNFVTGAFIVRAIDDAGLQIGTAQCTFDYVVVTN